MTIIRKPDWFQSLHGYLVSVAQTPFEPGKMDCALFTAGAVEAMTGANLYSEFGKYKTIEGGLKKLRKAGFLDQVDFVASHFEEIPPAFLQPGDIAVVEGEIDNALGIVQGHVIYVMPPEGFMGTVSLTKAKRGFRVPYQTRK